MAAATSAPPIAHAIGGSLGSALALLLFYPLERARIELQSQASSANNVALENANQLESVEVEVELSGGEMEDGAKSIVVSSSDESSLLRTPSSEASWMRLESSFETDITRQHPDEVNEELTTRSWSTNSSSTTHTSNPLQQIEDRTSKLGLLKCLLDLHTRNSLYQGVAPIIATMVTSQFVFFYMHAYTKNKLKQTIISKSKRSLSLISSCLAGVINVLVTNPLWVVNMAIVTGETKSNSLSKEMLTLIKTFGIKHLWKGTSASILLVSNPIIQFFCYEQLKYARIGEPGAAAVLPPIEAFFVGALAKACATITTYPLQLTQTLLRLKDNGYKGTMDCLVQLYKRRGIQEWFTGMRAKLLQTVLTAAFTFLTYEQILGAVQSALIKGGRIP